MASSSKTIDARNDLWVTLRSGSGLCKAVREAYTGLMRTLFPLVCFFVLALFACQSTQKVDAPTTIEFRTEVQSDEEGAMEFSFEGRSLFLSQPRIYEMQVFESQDMFGNPAIGFTPAAHKREEFGDWTESIKGQYLAVLVNGEIISLPEVLARLDNGGVINGGGDGFTAKEVTDTIARVKSGSSQ